MSKSLIFTAEYNKVFRVFKQEFSDDMHGKSNIVQCNFEHVGVACKRDADMLLSVVNDSDDIVDIEVACEFHESFVTDEVNTHAMMLATA